jgi:hypothetical protein
MFNATTNQIKGLMTYLEKLEGDFFRPNNVISKDEEFPTEAWLKTLLIYDSEVIEQVERSFITNPPIEKIKLKLVAIRCAEINKTIKPRVASQLEIDLINEMYS